jgi:heme-degrading monooxygenase HmoA
MIVVSNRLQVAQGREEDFEKRFEGRARLVEHMPGFVRLEILRPVKSDYYIVLTTGKTKRRFALGPTAPSSKKRTATVRRRKSSPDQTFSKCMR